MESPTKNFQFKNKQKQLVGISVFGAMPQV
jgi:hypothetical protein